MKLNNKGMTLVETIIAFAIIALISTALLTLIMKVREKNNAEKFNQDMLEYKNTVVKAIEDTLLVDNKIFSVECEGLSNHVCPSGNVAVTLSRENSSVINFNNNILTDNLTSDYYLSFNNKQYVIPNSQDIAEPTMSVSLEDGDNNNVNDTLIIEVSYYELYDEDRINNLGFKVVIPYKNKLEVE